MGAPEVDRRCGGTVRYTLTQKHQSTYVKNRETKFGMIPNLRYQCHYHCCLYQSLVTCTNRQHVSDLKWVCICETGTVFSNCIVRMRIVTLQSRLSISSVFLWRAHSRRTHELLSTTFWNISVVPDIQAPTGGSGRWYKYFYMKSFASADALTS
jgi:hypothetical protein